MFNLKALNHSPIEWYIMLKVFNHLQIIIILFALKSAGALVAVKCHKLGRKSRSRWAQQGVTDEFGDFIVDLPSQLHAVPNLEKTCSITVLRVPKDSPCRPVYVRKQKGLRLSSAGNSIRIYNAGRIKFLHMTSRPLEACMKISGDKEMLW